MSKVVINNPTSWACTQAHPHCLACYNRRDGDSRARLHYCELARSYQRRPSRHALWYPRTEPNRSFPLKRNTRPSGDTGQLPRRALSADLELVSQLILLPYLLLFRVVFSP